jgi:hypothetical protein
MSSPKSSETVEAMLATINGEYGDDLLNELVDDLLLEFSLGVHRDCKTGKFSMTECISLNINNQSTGR